MAKTIYILNGPNLNLLGTREPDKYGHTTLSDLETICRSAAKARHHDIVFRQSNLEGDLVGWIQEAKAQGAAGIILNAAGYTTTSVSILDALLAVKLPVVEVHITNIHAREEFRHNSLVSRAATGLISGFGVASYTLAIDAIAGLPRAQSGTKVKDTKKKKKK
jgi:3-dehydroquinate dehydratase-2